MIIASEWWYITSQAPTYHLIINMSSNIVLPSLTKWTQQHLSAIIQATSKSSFAEAFDNFFARECNITVNGVHLSRDQYRQQLELESVSANSGAAFSDLKFDGAVEVPSNKNASVEVAVYSHVTSTSGSYIYF